MKNYLLALILLGFIYPNTVISQNKAVVRTKSITPSVSVSLPAETGDFRIDMLNMVNAIRQQGCKCGGKNMPPVSPLIWNDRLEDASIAHAKDMSNNNHFDHIGTDGSEIDIRANRAGYKWQQLGENIAWGYNDLREAMIGWIKSPSHCRQLMSSKVTEMGAARNNQYWVQDFGKQRTW